MTVKLFSPPLELHGSRTRVNGAFNLALVAEGYTEAEHRNRQFWMDADKVVRELKKTPPFSTFTSLMNIFGVAVVSERSAQAITARCPAQPVADRKTAFKVQFCLGNSPRSVRGDDALVKQAVRVDANLPFVDHMVVIVNSKLYGGLGPSRVSWITTAGADWPRTAVHELGHSAFDLIDEYEYHEPADPPTAFPGSEVAEPNATIDLSVSSFKWRSLVSSFTPWPTTVPSGTGPCTFNHPLAPGAAATAIGAFEGAAHAACKIYRPALTCLMRNHDDPFCAVCARQIVPTLHRNVVRESNPLVVSISPLPGQPSLWTHLLALPDPARPGIRSFLLLYDAVSGNYELRDLWQMIGQSIRLPVASGVIESDLVSFLPTMSAGQLQLTAYRFAPSSRIQYQIGPTLAPLQKVREDVLPLPVPTHAALATSGVDQLSLSYNRFTGSVVLEQLGPAGQTPTIIAVEQWESQWSILLPLQGWAAGLVFCYEWVQGTYAIRALPATFGGAPAPIWSAANGALPLVRQLTHAFPLVDGTGVYLIGYSAFTGASSIYALRGGGRGLDFHARLKLDPGAPMMPTLAQGHAALDLVDVLAPGQTGGSPNFLTYSQSLGRLQFYATFGR